MRRSVLAHTFALTVGLVLVGSRAHAQASRQSLTVRGDRARAERERVEAASRFATSIDARERGLRTSNVADLLDEAPGVHARHNGDALSPTTIAFRGAASSHITIALDGVVLNDAGAGGGVDVSLIAPALLERVDVYRGVAPARLGMGGLGGAVEFITRPPTRSPRVQLTAGVGSFLERRATAAFTGALGPIDAIASLSYRGTQGNFTFYDDRGTPLDTAHDDPDASRVNNAGNAISALARACGGPIRARACGLLLADFRDRGMPGPGSAQLTSPTLRQWRILGRLSDRLVMPHGTVEPFVALHVHDDHFVDREGQVFAGQPSDASSRGTRTEWGFVAQGIARHVFAEGTLRQRVESYATASNGFTQLDALRSAILGAADVRLSYGPVEVTGSLAGEVIHDARRDSAARDRVLLSPRLGARILVADWLDLRANVAHLERAPTLVDLYGLQGYLLDNFDLRPERSDGGDLGAVLHVRRADWSTRLELVGHGRRARDLITLVRRGATAYKAFNLGDARVLGVEALARFSWRSHLEVVASYAFTDAVSISRDPSVDGRHPPGIPQHDLYARVQGSLGPVSAWADVSFVSGVYLDEFNSMAAPPRALVGVGALVRVPWVRGLAASFTVSNLLDQRSATVAVHRGRDYCIVQPIEDFIGYPLPGRAFFASLQYTFEVPE